LFCCKLTTMAAGLNVLVAMDFLGALLYGANIAGVILGFQGGTMAFYYATQVLKVPIMLDLNTTLLAVSSLVIAVVSIPRIFAYLYLKADPLDYLRRGDYYRVRFVTYILLVILQVTLLVITLVSIGRQPDFSPKNTFLFSYLVPMTIAYGSVAVITIPLDAYWTI
jgi:hypothetical protein